MISSLSALTNKEGVEALSLWPQPQKEFKYGHVHLIYPRLLLGKSLLKVAVCIISLCWFTTAWLTVLHVREDGSLPEKLPLQYCIGFLMCHMLSWLPPDQELSYILNQSDVFNIFSSWMSSSGPWAKLGPCHFFLALETIKKITPIMQHNPNTKNLWLLVTFESEGNFPVFTFVHFISYSLFSYLGWSKTCLDPCKVPLLYLEIFLPSVDINVGTQLCPSLKCWPIVNLNLTALVEIMSSIV